MCKITLYRVIHFVVSKINEIKHDIMCEPLHHLRSTRCSSKKSLMVSNCTIWMASWYRHDEKLSGQEIFFAIKPYSFELCGTVLLKPHILQIVFFNSRQNKSRSSYDHNASNSHSFHRRFRRSKVQSHFRTKECIKQWAFLDVIASLQLLEHSQNRKYNNFVY